MKRLGFLFLAGCAGLIAGCPLPLDPRGNYGETGARSKLQLVVTASPAEAGTVARQPDNAEYEAGTEVTLAANPAAGYQFSRWEGDATGSENPVKVTLDRGKTARAVFIQSSLTVQSSPPSGGTVTVSPKQARYEPGTNVTLTAVPAPGYVFVRWIGASGSENPINITMNGAKSVTASFGYNSLKLAVKAGRYCSFQTVDDPNYQVWTEIQGVSVAMSPGRATYEYGAAVTLTASPSIDYRFVRWETVATWFQLGTQGWEEKVVISSFSENPVATVTMDSDKTVRAVFVPAKPSIWLSRYSIHKDVFTGCTYPPGPFSVSVQITNDGTGSLSGLAASFPNGKPAWLSISLSGSTAPATLTATFEGSVATAVQSMPEGAQAQSLIQITSPWAMNSPQNIQVTITHAVKPVSTTFPPDTYTGPYPVVPQFKVICAELHRQGLMDEAIWKADEAFGEYLSQNHEDVLLGYQLWAKPVVKWMQKSRTVTTVVSFVATPWSYEMAYRMGARENGSFAGKVLMDGGVPLCRAIGKVAAWVQGGATPTVAQSHKRP